MLDRRLSFSVVRPVQLGLILCGLLLLSLAACGDSDGPDNLGNRTLRGSVSLPEGVTAAQVVNSLGAGVVVDDDFTLRLFNGGAGDRQLAAAVSINNHPLLLGWLGPQDAALSPRTTAEVLVWFAAGGFLLPEAQQDELLALLGQANELEALATAIAAELAASPEGLSADSATLAAALNQSVVALLGAGADRALDIDPSQARGGVALIADNDQDQLRLTNALPRPAHVLIDRVATFDDAGAVTPSSASVARLPLPVASVASGAAGLDELLRGVGETQAASAGPVALPLVEGAATTRHRVTVLGPGAAEGDAGDLSEAEQAALDAVALEFTLDQLLLPAIGQMLAPVGHLSALLDAEAQAGLRAELAGLLGDVGTDAATAAVAGNLATALDGLFGALLTNATLRTELVGAVLERFGQNDVEPADALATAIAQVLARTDAVETLVGAVDRTALGQAVAAAPRALVWTVDVDADEDDEPVTEVTLAPESANVLPGERVVFSVQVPPGSGSPLRYRWSLRDVGVPPGGVFINDAGERVVTLETSNPEVPYIAGTRQAVDQVQVQVLGADQQVMGNDQATVVIRKHFQFALVPQNDLVFAGEARPYTGSTGEAPDDTLRFRWSTTGNFGEISNADGQGPLISGADHEIIYQAGTQPGTDTITVEVFRVIDGEVHSKLAEESTTTTVVAIPFVDEDSELYIVPRVDPLTGQTLPIEGNSGGAVVYNRYYVFTDPGVDALKVSWTWPGEDEPRTRFITRNNPGSGGFFDPAGWRTEVERNYGHLGPLIGPKFEVPEGMVVYAVQAFGGGVRRDPASVAQVLDKIAQTDAFYEDVTYTFEPR